MAWPGDIVTAGSGEVCAGLISGWEPCVIVSHVVSIENYMKTFGLRTIFQRMLRWIVHVIKGLLFE